MRPYWLETWLLGHCRKSRQHQHKSNYESTDQLFELATRSGKTFLLITLLGPFWTFFALSILRLFCNVFSVEAQALFFHTTLTHNAPSK